MLEERDSNRWDINGWSALQSAVTLVMMVLAVLIWGMKLESRIDIMESIYRTELEKISAKVDSIEVATQKGILPVTSVRMDAIESHIRELRRSLDEFQGKGRR